MACRSAGWMLATLALAGPPAFADSPGAGGQSTSGSVSQPISLGAVSPSMTVGAVSQSYCGPILFGGPAGFAWGPYGPMPVFSPFGVIGPGGYFPPDSFQRPIPYAPFSPRAALPAPMIAPNIEPPRPRRRGNPAKAAELVTVGDRLFRAGNLPRAQLRYEQAIKAHPNSSAARVRLAEIALVRGQYTEAAERLREAQTAEPGWIDRASDVQALFPEPTKFAAHIARIEAHLQRHPDDRDAWLMLGAQWFLSGRVQLAADVFLRLDDPSRPPDETLQAFLDASKAE